MKFDDFLTHVGAFGSYQRRVYFVMTLIAVPSALHTFSGVFLSAKTDYWCAAPELADYNCSASSLASWLSGNFHCLSLKKNLSIPREVDQVSGESCFAQCERYNLTGVDLGDAVNVLRVLAQPPLVVDGDEDEGRDRVGYEEIGGPRTNRSLEVEGSVPIIPCDAGWEYDTSQYLSTIIHQIGLSTENETVWKSTVKSKQNILSYRPISVI